MISEEIKVLNFTLSEKFRPVSKLIFIRKLKTNSLKEELLPINTLMNIYFTSKITQYHAADFCSARNPDFRIYAVT